MPETGPPVRGLDPGGSDGELTRTLAQTCDVVAPAFANGTGVSHDQLLWTAMNAWAPATTVSLLMRLPSRYYFTLDDVRTELASSLAV